MLKIRFARAGRKHVPFFRIVVTEHTRAPQNGYLKVLGFYNPVSKEISIDKEATKKYIDNGAQFSDSVVKTLARNNISLS